MMRFPMWRQAKRVLFAMAATYLTIGVAARVRADVVYSDNFSNGITFTVNDPYWLDNNRANGFVTQTTNTSAIWPGSPGEFGNDIPQGVSPGGYFLFEGTYNYSGSSVNIPAGHDEFFISPTFDVNPNTIYSVSFYATNADAINIASIQPELGGSLLGSPISPPGDYQNGNVWQQYTFTWNSGSNTSASLILHDYQQSPDGNDFGIANIQVASVPEPSSIILLCVGAAGLAGFTNSRRSTARHCSEAVEHR